MFQRRFRFQMTEDDTSGGGGGSLPPSDGAPGLESSGGDGGQQRTPEPWEALPRSWTADLESHWKTAPVEVRQFAHRREADVEKLHGLYRDKSTRYDRLHSQFAEYAQQNPDLDVVGVYEALAQNHLALSRAEPAQRRELFMQLARQYGVDFAEAASTSGSAPEGLTAAQRAELQAMLGPVVQTVKAQQSELETRKLAEAGKAVDAFASDPKNKYFKEAGPLMAQILQSGQAKDLSAAYELACLQTPSVRGKYLADLHAAGLNPGGQGEGGPRNVKSSTEGAPPPTGRTIDEDMRAIAKKHFPAWTGR